MLKALNGKKTKAGIWLGVLAAIYSTLMAPLGLPPIPAEFVEVAQQLAQLLIGIGLVHKVEKGELGKR